MRAHKKRWANGMAWRAEQNPDVTRKIPEERYVNCERAFGDKRADASAIQTAAKAA
jgi:hypothetical protein